MYGGAGKHGRGGGRGGGAVPGKRSNNLPSSFHQPPPPHRPSSSGGRLSMGGAAAPRNRGPSCVATTSSAPSMADETFSLITGNPLNFAMIIRLAPDLVDEIKRVEAQGGSARIKFDANANNPSGNVIDVAGKNFRFTWSREIGDLCDIYEERQSGEDGEGLLVESGCAWRKLNVQRILDESTKNQVKKRSEEAERQLKSRKAIILDHGNPSMKNQMKALAAAETTPWRKPFKQKKESEFKKRKFETPPGAVGGPPRSVYKSGLPLTTSVTGRPSVSPSPPDQSGAPASPYITGSLTRGNISAEDVLPNQVTTKENAISSEKEKFNKTSSGALQEKPGRKGSVAAKSMDLQTMLISFLKENPKGMSLKALEKAVGDAVPNSIKKIEPIIKKIATFQAPGRYILKPGVELENMKKPSSECGSSPEVNGQQTPVAEEKHEDIPISMPNFAQKSSLIELEKQTLLNPSIGEDLNSFEKIDIQRHSPDLFGSKKVSDNSEGPAGSSSDSGSDSDSSESGSDSGSHSRSKSRSPVKSGSGSSSDSDSDASSNSKQGPDEDVDIMTSDDEKDSKPKMQTPEPKFSISPIQWRFSEGGNVENGIGEKEDVNDSDLVEIEKDLPDDFQETGMAVIDSLKDSTKPLGEYQENQVHTGFIFNEREKISNDASKHEQSKNSERISKSKSKRGSDSKQPHEKSGHAKRLKAGSLPQQPLSQLRDPPLSVSPQRLSSDWVVEDPYKGRSSQMANRASNDGNADSGFQKGYNQGFSGKSSMDSQNSGRRPSDPSGRAIAPDTAEIPVVYPGSMESGIVRSVKNNQSHEGLPLQKDKVHSEVQDENCYNKEKKMSRNSTESSFDDKTPVTIGRGKILQRELSELELGEFREPLPEETSGGRRFERKSSFKESETKPSTSDYWNSELNKGKPTVKKTAEPVKPSPPQFRVGISSNIDAPSKKTPEQPEDLTRPSNRLSQPEGALHPIRADRMEIGTRKSVDVNGKLRHNEARVNQENGVDVLGDAYKKASVSVPQQHGIERGPVSHPKKESRTHKSNTCPEPSDIRKDTSLTESSEGVMKRRESSSDENSCSYSKYEKEEPELKGPIKDFSQYKEYVQEYREKYDSYCSLNKTLESYRNEFEKLGKDLEISKGRDMEKYYHILEQLKASYRQCGTRHKRLKKIFVVLHEELQHLKQMIKDYAVSYTME